MRFCFHKWSNWGDQYETFEKRSRGSFGDTSTDSVVAQERFCHKCGKVEVRILRDGKLSESKGSCDD